MRIFFKFYLCNQKISVIFAKEILKTKVMSNINDLEVLSKYLSEDELKAVAKEVAYAHFSSKLKEANPHAKSNLEFYIAQGAYQAVLQYGEQLNFDFHAQELKEKVSKNIKALTVYNLPSTYTKIAEEAIEENRGIIQDRMKNLISEFVNGGDYPNIYGTFQDKVGETLADLLYELLEEKFKK